MVSSPLDVIDCFWLHRDVISHTEKTYNVLRSYPPSILISYCLLLFSAFCFLFFSGKLFAERVNEKKRKREEEIFTKAKENLRY